MEQAKQCCKRQQLIAHDFVSLGETSPLPDFLDLKRQGESVIHVYENTKNTSVGHFKTFNEIPNTTHAVINRKPFTLALWKKASITR